MEQSQPWLPSNGSMSAQDALITASTAPLLKLRQNNPQDCTNLIAASVDRATVEISRTIIALNATFSQQLQQASISASNGIKSAESSASSSISIVSQNASSATSSASFRLNLANLAVTSVNSALANANIALVSAQSQVVGANLILTSALSASTSDVSRLSSSLSSLEATLVSVRASASAAAALAVMSQQPLMDPQGTTAISLAPIQLAGIVAGTMVASVLLGFILGFVLIRIRNKEESKASTKEATRDQKMPLSRSNTFPAKFSPPTSVYDDEPASERTEMPIATFLNIKSDTQKPSTPRSKVWPLNDTSDLFGPKITTSVPPSVSAHTSAGQLVLEDFQDKHSTVNYALPPGKAGNSTFVENPVVVRPNPATHPGFTLELMHRLAGESGRDVEVVVPLHERDMGEQPWTIREHSPLSSCGVGAKKLEQHVIAARASENPFVDYFAGPENSTINKSFKDTVEPSFGKPEQAPNETLMDRGSYQDPIDQENTVWKEANNTSLRTGAWEWVARNVEDRKPEAALSSPVVAETQHLAEKNGPTVKGNSSHRHENARLWQVQDRRPPVVRGTDTRSHTRPKARGRVSSPLRQNTLVDFFETRVEAQSPAIEEERELSPLRRNPPFEAITSFLELVEEGVDEHESRGRSMIRTSNILEARISGLAKTNKSHDQTLEQRGSQAESSDSRPISPVRQQQLSRTSDSIRADQTSPKQEQFASDTVPRDKSSPPRQDNPGIGPDPRPAKVFTQALSKFQTLASQAAQDSVLASHEVTSRAIAGIHIPGSLREQAVRNLSKSRERGTVGRQRE